MVNFPTRIPDSDSHSPALLDLIISSDTSICSTLAFPPLANSDDVVSVSIITHDYSSADWDSFYDYLRDVPRGIFLNSVLLLLLREFCE